jgi:hypothetical protein
MTMSLAAGLTFDQAVQAVCDAAIAARGTSRCGIWSETGTEKVLVGIARADQPAFVLEVARSEYDGIKLLEILGEPLIPSPAKPKVKGMNP